MVHVTCTQLCDAALSLCALFVCVLLQLDPIFASAILFPLSNFTYTRESKDCNTMQWSRRGWKVGRNEALGLALRLSTCTLFHRGDAGCCVLKTSSLIVNRATELVPEMALKPQRSAQMKGVCSPVSRMANEREMHPSLSSRTPIYPAARPATSPACLHLSCFMLSPNHTLIHVLSIFGTSVGC